MSIKLLVISSALRKKIRENTLSFSIFIAENIRHSQNNAIVNRLYVYFRVYIVPSAADVAYPVVELF